MIYFTGSLCCSHESFADTFLSYEMYLHKISEMLTMTLRLRDISQALCAAVLRVLQTPFLAVGVYLHKNIIRIVDHDSQTRGHCTSSLCCSLESFADIFLCCGIVPAQNIIRIVDHDSQTRRHGTSSLCSSLDTDTFLRGYLHKISSEMLTMTLKLGDISQALCACSLESFADTFLSCGSIPAQKYH